MDSPFTHSFPGVQTIEQGSVPSVICSCSEKRSRAWPSLGSFLPFCSAACRLNVAAPPSRHTDGLWWAISSLCSISPSLCLPAAIQVIALNHKWQHHLGWNIFCPSHGSLNIWCVRLKALNIFSPIVSVDLLLAYPSRSFSCVFIKSCDNRCSTYFTMIQNLLKSAC